MLRRTVIFMDNRHDDAANSAASEEFQFRRLADKAPFMIWRSDLHRRCDYFNPAWLDFTGRSLEDEVGLGWMRGIGQSDYQRCLDMIQASLSRLIPFTMDYRLRRHDGEYRWILSNGVPYRRGEAFAGFLGSCVDISEHDAGDAAQGADPAIRQAAMRELNHRVKNSLQTTICFSAFNTPMADELAQDELSRVTERLSLLALVHEEVSRSGTGPAVNLGEYLGRLAESIHAAMRKPNVTLTVSAQSALLSKPRATAIGTIVDELLTTALTQRFPEHRQGTIQVDSRPLPDDRIEVSISDDGLSETLGAELASKSYERQLLERLTAHAGGTIRYEFDRGTRSIITLDPDELGRGTVAQGQSRAPET